MAWVTISETDLLIRQCGPELAAVRAAALATGEAAPLIQSIIDTVEFVRGRVAACPNNTLAAGETIPSELKLPAVSILRYFMLTRLPSSGLLDDDRRQEYRDALRMLDQVAACELRIECPATESTQVIAGPATVLVTHQCRVATREDQRGL